jgi:hypothetical protein
MKTTPWMTCKCFIPSDIQMHHSHLKFSYANTTNVTLGGPTDKEGTSSMEGAFEPASYLADIAPVSEAYLAELDDRVHQNKVLENIIGTTLHDPTYVDPFDETPVYKLRLSKLQQYYEAKDPRVYNLLSGRHKISIDNHFKLDFGKGEILMDTSQTMIDYQLVVANSIGFDILLPNADNGPRFDFDMDLKRQQKHFKGKHGMVGFDTKGRMLYLGKANNEEVYLAMAPNEFLGAHFEPCTAGYSTGSSVMSRRHYRQMVMMFAHFLPMIRDHAYYTIGDVYDQDLDGNEPNWGYTTNIMYVNIFYIFKHA